MATGALQLRQMQNQTRQAIALWLFRAEREVQLAFESVQRDGTNENRDRYARARRDLDAAFAASAQVLAVPSHAIAVA
jgi:hypothetical protein